MSTRVSWWLLNAERLLTINAAQAVMTLFCVLSVGLTLGEVGILEAVSSVVYLLFNIPTGWMADRVNRRICNSIGDACYGISLIMLGNATSFTDVIVARTIMAFGNSCSQGADEGLFKAHCDQMGKEYTAAKKKISVVLSWTGFGYYTLGGVLTALYGMKTTILLASIPYFAGAIVSCFIKELGSHKEVVIDRPSFKSKTKTEIQELAKVLWFALRKDPKLSWLLIATSVATVMGGPIMGLAGPIVIAAGGSEELAGASHMAISAASICGGELSKRVFDTWDPKRLFLVMSSISLTVMVVTSVHFTLWTAALHIVAVQVIRVLLVTSLSPLIQQAAPDEIQSTVASLGSTISQSLYIIVVVAINFAADHGVRWGIAANFLLFAPLVVIAIRAHYRRNEGS